MKKVFYLLYLAVWATTSLSFAQQHTLIPAPVSYQSTGSFFVLTNQLTLDVQTNQPAVLKAMTTFERALQKRNIVLSKSLDTKKKGKILEVKLLKEANARLGNEGYQLTIDENRISLAANEPAGIFYGIQSLHQLLPPDLANTTSEIRIPTCQILDYPRFGWRGLMVDVSRHFRTKQEMKDFIDQMVQYKFNVLHWHLTDDQGWRIEIKSLPKLTEIGACRVQRMGIWWEREAPKPNEQATDCGFYTQDDIREIIAYAQENHVQIIPEIDVPGHSMAALAAYPELSVTQDTSIRVNPGSQFATWHGNGTFTMHIDNNLDPTNEQVYVFLDKVFTEIAALFPFPYIHIGGDECYKGYWERAEHVQKFMAKNNIADSHALQSYFIQRVEKIVSSKGKKIIGWDEILEGGLAPNAAVMSWRGMAGGIEAAKMGHEVVMTPNQHAYLDLYQGDPSLEPPTYSQLTLKNAYQFEPVPEGVNPSLIKGGQGNLWSERFATLRAMEYMAYPRAWALAEVFWSPAKEKNWTFFLKRLSTHFERADNQEIAYSKAHLDPIIRTKKGEDGVYVSLQSDIPNTKIYYSLDQFPADSFSTLYEKPFLLPKEPTLLHVIVYKDNQPLGRMVRLSTTELEKR